ncbi:MAG TPA: histidine phosphatase family protein [Pyrinomonadaceae bacterium]|nr:histidine phosphatase family protein [Pyrinomonadaceae bacterium]
MKTLLLLRHAKSSWDDPSLRDFDRPLNKRGKRAAPLMAAHMRRKKVRPSLVVSSPAERAKQTALLVSEHAGFASPPRFDERIYDAELSTLVEVVSQLDDSADEVLLVGHNPGMEELLTHLTGAQERMPTAALARLELDVERWADVRAACGRLAWVARPKELEGD